MKIVKDEGSAQARIVLVGEAPGRTEELQGRPFIGPSGAQLERIWREIGLVRKDFFITNVVPYRPANNDIKEVSSQELEEWCRQLREKLATLPNACVIVPVGNTALYALTGMSGVLNRRGSIYRWEERAVIPTVHPAALFRQPDLLRRMKVDWLRIKTALDLNGELYPTEREHYIRPTLDDCLDYLDCASTADVLSFDIETPRKQSTIKVGEYKNGNPKYQKVLGEARITCIGFAITPNHSFTIPTTREYWGSKAALIQVWSIIRQLLELPQPKIACNNLFDRFYLKLDHGIDVRNMLYDCRWMHHCIDPTDDHDLAYMASVDTLSQYWKDEAKDPDQITQFTTDLDRFWLYNGKDAAVPVELAAVYAARLGERFKHYRANYVDMFNPLLDMMVGGVRLDEAKRALKYAQLVAKCIGIQDKLTAIAGEQLYGKTDLSPTKLKRFLYETLGLPKMLRKNAKKDLVASSNEVTIRKLMLKHPLKMAEPGRLILAHRRYNKLLTFFKPAALDTDGRVRCEYTLAPETGRLSSRKNPKRTGMNLQNVDRQARQGFMPEPGHVGIEMDLSQVEKRIVDCLTGDEELIRLARTKPWEHDAHTHNAALIFGIPVIEVTKEQRYLGKRAVHASNYGMKGPKLAEQLLLDGYVLDPDECQRMIDAYLNNARPIVRWQMAVRQRIIKTRKLSNSWGDAIDYSHCFLNDELFRRGYAYEPQSEAARLLNRRGLRPLYDLIRGTGMQSRIKLQLHDALWVSCPSDEAWDVWQFTKEQLEAPRCLSNGIELSVPLDLKIGRSWGEAVEFKQPPTYERFMEVVEQELRGGGA